MVNISGNSESVNLARFTASRFYWYCLIQWKLLIFLLLNMKIMAISFTFPFLVQCYCHAHAYCMCLVWGGTAACHWISIYYKLMLIEYNCSAVSNVHWLSKFVKLVWSLIVIMTVLGGWLDHSRMARNIMLCHYLKLLSAPGGCSPRRLFVSHC